MNKKFTSALLFILITSFLHAEDKRPNFADMPFGSSRDEVKKMLSSKGYVFSKNLKHQDLLFTGEVASVKAQIGVVFNEDGKLVRTVVILLTEDKNAIAKFRSLRESLIKKYGKPKDDTVDVFLSPYEKGDGYAEQAVKLGKGLFLTQFKGDVSLYVTEGLAVRIEYNGVLWEKESERRQNTANEDL